MDRSRWTSLAWWLRIGAGGAKLSAGILLAIAQNTLTSRGLDTSLWAKASAGLITGPIGFYLTTAGYFQIIENLGGLSGVAVPVSFNSPIGRVNLSEWWANWNMSVTSLFRDYLFFNRWGMKTYNPFVNSIILFTLVGLWHAGNWYWFLWGLLHGLLFASFLAWRRYVPREFLLPLRGTNASRTFAAALTYGSVCAAWYLPSKFIQRFS